MSKIIRIFLNFLFIEEYQFRADVDLTIFFCEKVLFITQLSSHLMRKLLKKILNVIYCPSSCIDASFLTSILQKSWLVKVKDIVRRPQNLKKNLPLTFDFYSVFRQMYEECFPKLCGILTLY